MISAKQLYDVYVACHSTEGCSVHAFDNAAGNGRLAVLVWLSVINHIGGTARALDLAATNGHYDVLQWLYQYHLSDAAHALLPLVPTRAAYDGAAGNGHLTCVQFLLSHYENLLSIASIELAARYVFICAVFNIFTMHCI